MYCRIFKFTTHYFCRIRKHTEKEKHEFYMHLKTTDVPKWIHCSFPLTKNYFNFEKQSIIRQTKYQRGFFQENKIYKNIKYWIRSNIITVCLRYALCILPNRYNNRIVNKVLNESHVIHCHMYPYDKSMCYSKCYPSNNQCRKIWPCYYKTKFLVTLPDMTSITALKLSHILLHLKVTL